MQHKSIPVGLSLEEGGVSHQINISDRRTKRRYLEYNKENMFWKNIE